MRELFKKVITITVLFLCALGLFAKGAGEKMHDMAQTKKSKRMESSVISNTNVQYPIFENEPKLNEFIYEKVKKALEEFTKANTVKAGERANLQFDVDYNTINQNNGYISFILTCFTYITGANHGTTKLIPVNYDTTKKKIITLEDLLMPGLETRLQMFSDEAEKQLTDLVKKGKLASDEEWIKKGTTPSIENFKNFEIMDDKIKITFDEYQVAPYSSGRPEIIIPLNLFK